LHHSEDNCERIHTVCHACSWLGTGNMRYRHTPLNACQKKSFCVRMLNFRTLHPGLPFFQKLPAALDTSCIGIVILEILCYFPDSQCAENIGNVILEVLYNVIFLIVKA
jgi:hypothetical protein